MHPTSSYYTDSQHSQTSDSDSFFQDGEVMDEYIVKIFSQNLLPTGPDAL